MSKKANPKDNPLWQAVIRDVKPLDRKGQSVGKPPVINKNHNGGITRIERPLLPEDFDETLSSATVPVQGLDRKHRRRLARGTADVDQVIDLHGLSREKAYALLARRVPAASLSGQRVLLVITGKGGARFHQKGDALPVERRRRSDFALHEGILRKALPEWLNGPALRPYVAALTQAADAHGGAGAFYLRLKSRKN